MKSLIEKLEGTDSGAKRVVELAKGIEKNLYLLLSDVENFTDENKVSKLGWPDDMVQWWEIADKVVGMLQNYKNPRTLSQKLRSI